MAKRRSGTTPYSRVMSKKVSPVVMFKNNLVTATDDTPVYEEVNFNLTEENAVMDIMAIETWMDPTSYDETVADGAVDIHCALLDNPAETALNLDTDAVFESTEEVIYYDHATWHHVVNTAVANKLYRTDMHRYRKFDEPFTVARNVAWVITMNQTTAFFGGAINLRAIVYARKRFAPDSEYRDLLYRLTH